MQGVFFVVGWLGLIGESCEGGLRALLFGGFDCLAEALDLDVGEDLVHDLGGIVL